MRFFWESQGMRLKADAAELSIYMKNVALHPWIHLPFFSVRPVGTVGLAVRRISRSVANISCCSSSSSYSVWCAVVRLRSHLYRPVLLSTFLPFDDFTLVCVCGLKNPAGLCMAGHCGAEKEKVDWIIQFVVAIHHQHPRSSNSSRASIESLEKIKRKRMALQKRWWCWYCVFRIWITSFDCVKPEIVRNVISIRGRNGQPRCGRIYTHTYFVVTCWWHFLFVRIVSIFEPTAD